MARLGERLLARNVLDEAGLARALLLQRKGDRLGSVLIRLGLISEYTLLEALSEQLALDIFDLSAHPELPEAARRYHADHRILRPLAQRFEFLVWQRESSEGTDTCVAARDPVSSALRDLLDGVIEGPYQFLLIAQRDFERMLAEVYRQQDVPVGDRDLRRLAEDAPVVELVNAVLARANDYASSDVHIEPLEHGFAVRYRIDGVLQGVEHYPADRYDAVVSRLKLIAGLDISERRLPQDGRFSSRAAGIEIDVRVSVIPSVLGESLVLRLLPSTQGRRFSLESLGFEGDHLATFAEWMRQPDGIILVTGPTGSGKSTTLYAALTACDREHERILTVEDPVEYQIEGVTQFQVHAEIGFTFPAALRSILRHDPDTIMIGEIRDADTARIAVQASLTGHRVLSTLHTNDSATAFLRLADLGVEQFLVGATVRGVIAQRLVRRLCHHCRAPVAQTDAIPAAMLRSVARLGILQPTFYRPVGCKACSGTGYRGRVAIYELLPATETIRAALSKANPSHMDLLAALSSDFRFLRDDGLIKAARGDTSVEEVVAVAGSVISSRDAR